VTYEHKDYLAQVTLKHEGHYAGALDGYWGRKSKEALEASKAARFGSAKEAKRLEGLPPRPKPTHRDKVRVFGQPGREDALKRVKAPWPMKIAWGGGHRTTLRLHHLIADRFVLALEEIRDTHGMAYVRAHGLDLFGGDYVNRRSRGSRATSDHAWGIAADLNPDANGLHHTWEPGARSENGTFEMSRAIVATCQKHGFQVGFRRSDGSRRDMMHIAYVDRQ
jgi:hypothetical protein